MASMKYAIVAIAAAAVASSSAWADDDAQALPPQFIEKVDATSTYASKTNAYDPRLAVDPTLGSDKNGDPVYKSAWCEGKKDAGIGESITVTFAVPTKIDKLTIKAGVWMTAKLFTANNIPTAITITTDDKRTFTAKPSATERKEAEVKIGGAAVKTMTFTIAEVKPGKMNDSCITELSFSDATVVTGVDAAGAAAYPAAAKAIFQTFWTQGDRTVDVACDPKAIAKYIELPFTWVDVTNTHASVNNLVRTQMTIKDAAKFLKECKSDPFFPGTPFDQAELSSPGPGRVSLQFMGAEAMQSLELRYKNGAWKAYAFD
jgi:hypothetical protein